MRAGTHTHGYVILRWKMFICRQTPWQFTGSGWGLWFSTKKWMLYKLGTQENLATDIKPIRATLGKWPPRSAFSKLWTVFFLRKTSPCLNGIMLKIIIKQLPGNASIFLGTNIQPIEFFELFEFHRKSIPLTSHKNTIEITPKMPRSAILSAHSPRRLQWNAARCGKCCKLRQERDGIRS